MANWRWESNAVHTRTHSRLCVSVSVSVRVGGSTPLQGFWVEIERKREGWVERGRQIREKREIVIEKEGKTSAGEKTEYRGGGERELQ